MAGALASSLLLGIAVVPLHGAEEAIAPPAAARLHCVVVPSAVVDVASSVSGRVKSVHAERGDTVQADQVLAVLESGVERATLQLAKARAELEADIRLREAQLAFEQRKVERAARLRVDSMISVQEQDKVRTDASMARLQLRQAIEDSQLANLELARAIEVLERRSVRSPIDGTVVERFKWPGEHVDEEPVLRVARLDPLWVEVTAPVAMYGEIRKGMLAEIMVETVAGGARDARVIVVDPMADAASGTFRVRMELPNADRKLLGGTKCKARFPRPARYAPTAKDEPISPGRTEGAHPAPVPGAQSVRSRVSVDRSSAAAIANDDETGDDATDRYIVLTSRTDSDVERRQLADDLAGAGISDVQIMRSGPYDGRISLGVFSLRGRAEKHGARLAALGFETETLRYEPGGTSDRGAGNGSDTPPADGTRRLGAARPGRGSAATGGAPPSSRTPSGCPVADRCPTSSPRS